MNRICIIAPNWLGDLTMSFAFFKNLIKMYPEAKIDVLIKSNLKPIFNLFNEFDLNNIQLCQYNNKNNPFDIARSTLHKNYDLFIPLPNSFSSGLVGFLIKAKSRIGFKNEFREFFLNKSYKIPKNIHLTEKYNYLLKGLTNNNLSNDISIHINQNNYQNNTSFLKFLDNTKSNILVNPKAIGPNKTIPKNYLIDVLNKLNHNNQYNIIFAGIPTDTGYINEIQSKLHFETMNSCGQTSIIEFILLLNKCDLIISNDSGPAHIASALNKKQIVFFGKANPDITGPYNKNKLLILRKKPKNETNMIDWMLELSPSYVLPKIKEFI